MWSHNFALERLWCYWGGNVMQLQFKYLTVCTLSMICAELAGDFHLGYARQLTDKSSLLFDLAF